MGLLSDAQRMKPAKISVEIDIGLYKALEAIGGMRDIHPLTLIELQLTGFVRSFERAAVLEPNDTMPYGKYKGFKMEDVIKGDARYINYLLSHSTNFKLGEKSMELLESLETDETP